jgi:hypothetical protein
MKPTLVVNPATDEVFAEFAELLLDDGAIAAEDLERRLRKVYPNATVHERQLSGELALIWYIYREGRWISSQPASSERGSVDDNARARRGSEVDS